MAKDPAFLFYPESFIMGTTFMDYAEKGQYIHLLCLLHQHGGALSKQKLEKALGSISVNVFEKLSIDENGNYYNEKLSSEMEKRNNFIQSRIDNGLKGGRPVVEQKPSAKPNGEAKNKLIRDRDKDKDINKELYIYIDNNSFLDAFNDFLEMRKSIKAVPTDRAINLILKDLHKHDTETAIKMLNESTKNNWKGVFPLKTEKTQKGGLEKWASKN